MMRVPAAVIQSDAIASGYVVPMVDAYAINLRTLFDAAYPAASLGSGDEINFNGSGTAIGTSVMIGSNAAAGTPSLTRGSWPAGVIIKVNNLIVLGRGGTTDVGNPLYRAGGDAVDCQSGSIIFNACYLAGGGGGGRDVKYDMDLPWVRGGGGAGSFTGFGNPSGSYTQGGVTTAGGGNGGDLGQAGIDGSYGPVVAFIAAGAAGRAIVGAANATLNSCTVIGATV